MSEKEKTTNVGNSGGGLEKLHYKQELNRVLKLPSVVFFGIAYPHIGFMAGWGILLDYILLPMFNYVAIGVYIHILIPEIPVVVFMAAFIIIVTIVNLLGMNFTKIFNNTLIVIQLIFLVSVILFSIKYIVGGGGLGTLGDTSAFFNTAEFNTPEVGWAGIFAGASILCMSFLGFDSVTTSAEETIEPE